MKFQNRRRGTLKAGTAGAVLTVGSVGVGVKLGVPTVESRKPVGMPGTPIWPGAPASEPPGMADDPLGKMGLGTPTAGLGA